MKRKTMQRKIFALILSILMLVPMFTFSGSAANTREAKTENAYLSTTDTIPTSKYFFQTTTVDGYDCRSYVYTCSYANINVHYTQASIDFFWADSLSTMYSTLMQYDIVHRIYYYGYHDSDTLSDSVVVYDECYLDEDDKFVKLNYNMQDADICRYIFGSFDVNNRVVGAINRSKDVDFALDVP